MQIIGTKGSIHMRKEFNSATGFVSHTNISVIPMFWNTSMAALMSLENALSGL